MIDLPYPQSKTGYKHEIINTWVPGMDAHYFYESHIQKHRTIPLFSFVFHHFGQMVENIGELTGEFSIREQIEAIGLPTKPVILSPMYVHLRDYFLEQGFCVIEECEQRNTNRAYIQAPFEIVFAEREGRLYKMACFHVSYALLGGNGEVISELYLEKPA